MDTPIRLSPPEKQTLKHLAATQNDPSELDWLALPRLKLSLRPRARDAA
jgi:hypothetical protein